MFSRGDYITLVARKLLHAREVEVNMPTATPPIELERQRRLSGLKFSDVARSSGVQYMRLYRYFMGGSPLTEDEIASITAVINAAVTDAPS